LRAVYEPNAVCFEQTNRQSDKELKMRVRIIAQTFTDLWRHRALLNPIRSGFYGVQLLSHKVMRYLVPFFLMGLFVSSAVLAPGSLFFRLVLAAQLACYACPALAWMLDRVGIRSRLLAFPQYFMLANLASAATNSCAASVMQVGNRFVEDQPTFDHEAKRFIHHR